MEPEKENPSVAAGILPLHKYLRQQRSCNIYPGFNSNSNEPLGKMSNEVREFLAQRYF